jgi:hypothetical protein
LGIGYWVGNEDTLLQGGVAFALAFVPAALTLGLVVYSYSSTPELQLTASLGGSGVRMAVALGGGLFLTTTQPLLFATPFWSWLVLYYLVLLGFEITLLVWRSRSPQASG